MTNLNGHTIGSHGLVTMRSFCWNDFQKNSQPAQPNTTIAGKKKSA
jgi:hypothetical protein